MNFVSTIRLLARSILGLTISTILLCSPRSNQTHAQEASPLPIGASNSVESIDQIWVGWIESPESHLRWIIKLQKGQEQWNGSIQLPDRINLAPISLSKLSVSDTSLSFSWQPTKENQEASFVGNVEQPNVIKGLVLQGESSLFSKLRRVDKIGDESPDTLGADSIWLDQTPTRAKIIPYDLRLRIYSSGPYFDGEDRILLDSRSSNIVGAPVQLNQSQAPKWSFRIPSLQVEYVAELNDAEDTLSGFLKGNSNSKALQLFHWTNTSDKAKSSTANLQSNKPETETRPKTSAPKQTEPASEMSTPSEKPTDSTNDSNAVKIKLNNPKDGLKTSEDGEDEFLLTVASTGAKSKSSSMAHQLGCTLKLPSLDSGSKAPLAVIVSTFDPQERDGIVGESKIYKQLALALAERGIATLRFDDRGTGTSSPPSADYGLQEAVSDLKAVLEYARGLPEIDRSKIGIIGHGFGAALATKLATTDPSIAFLVCMAPAGVDGSSLLLAELRKTSELEELDSSSIQLLLDLQKDLHAMALKPSSNEVQMTLEFDDLFRSYWPRLSASIAKSQQAESSDNKTSDEQIKQAIEQKLRNDLSSFRSRFNRDFLGDDPSSHWMILQPPTLAVWGSKDVQVDAQTNQVILKQAVRRNPKNRVSWSVLPDLNHLFQECKTGLPLEYQELRGGIAPSAIETILSWLVEQRIIQK